MILALGAMHVVTEGVLKFAKQLGVSGMIVRTPPLRGDKYHKYFNLLHLGRRVKDAGLRPAVIENAPSRW